MIDRRGVLAGGLGLFVAGCAAPLASVASVAVVTRQFALTMPNGRAISVSEWSPDMRPLGTIAFSHGAASDPAKYAPMMEAWARAGWRVLAPLHVDSLLHPDTAAFKGMASWRARLEDMAVLSAHIGDASYVAAGHSYGGLVALTLGGASPVPPEGMAHPLSDRNVTAALAFSPPAPIPVLITREGYATLSVPALIQTGTKDIVPGITDADGWVGHLAPYEAAAPNGNRYALVLDGVDHYFGGAICRHDLPGPPQVAELGQAIAISTEFLAAFGTDDAEAKATLNARLTPNLPVRLTRR